MSQWFKRDSKWRTNSPAYIFLKLIKQFQVATRSTCSDMTRIYHAWPYGRFIEIKSNLRGKKFHTTTLSSNFLGGNLSNRDNVRAPIKFKRESQPQHLKRLFFLKNRPIYFRINSTSVIRPIKVFSALKSTSDFQFQCTVSHRSDSRSKANFSCYHRSDAWSYLQ